MPQYPNARINFCDILEAIEIKLVMDSVVDVDKIAWGMPDSVPPFVSPFEILLIVRNGEHTRYDAGAGQLPMERKVEILYRSQAPEDYRSQDAKTRRTALKTWMRAKFTKGDQIINSVGSDSFWPQDSDGNLLTLQAIKLDRDAAPNHPNNSTLYGDFVCTLVCVYFPEIDPTQGPHA